MKLIKSVRTRVVNLRAGLSGLAEILAVTARPNPPEISAHSAPSISDSQASKAYPRIDFENI